ncbi:MAG: ABC transporter permease [Candidatus Omnitrophota bacterium]|nr:ABC transporter permease [Candidatus Omnitrophota bacterium]
MKEKIKRLYFQRQLIINIVLKELKNKYAGSFLGIFWAVVNPLLIMTAINFVFTNVMKMNIKDFPLFVLSALLPWMSFSASIYDATNSISRNGHLLNQFNISKEILPVSAVAVNFINLFLGLIIMIPVFAIFKFKIIFFLFLLPFIFLLHLIFTLGLGLLLSCLNVFFRDIYHFLEVGLLFWFWVTPVFYSLDMIPFRFQWACKLNPMAIYVTMYRNILFEARFPNIGLLIIAIAMSMLMLITGYFMFLKYEPAFLKRV